MDRKTTLQQAIDRASRIYYYTGKTIFEDAQFDALIEELRGIDPDDTRVMRVGFPVPQDSMLKKVQHRVQSNSLAKADTEGDLRKWAMDMRYLASTLTAGGAGLDNIMVQLKADGATIIIYYVDGILDLAATRGGDDGVGEDVTQNAYKFKNLPHRLPVPFTGGIRGEVLITKADFPSVDPTLQGNVRNIGNGIARRTDGTQSEFITFVAFNFEDLANSVPPCPSEDEKIKTLKAWGFIPIESRLCYDIDDAVSYWKEIEVRRKADDLPYKIDGVVFKMDGRELQEKAGVTSGRPKAQRVLKFEAPGAETVLNGVVITLGHTGVIKPTACLDPVIIDNTSVKSAQLNNWDLIEAMDVAIGDRVRVIKAKDIIPQLTHVVDRIYICPECGFRGTLTEQEAYHVKKD